MYKKSIMSINFYKNLEHWLYKDIVSSVKEWPFLRKKENRMDGIIPHFIENFLKV